MSTLDEMMPFNFMARELAGTWKVDLRLSLEAEPDYQAFEVSHIDRDTFQGTFSGRTVQDGIINTSWYQIHFAFTTADKTHTYYHTGLLQNGLLHGMTYCPERKMVTQWSGKREVVEKDVNPSMKKPVLNADQEALIAAIKEAFKGVKLDHGVSLHGTVVKDNYGSKEEMMEWYDRDETQDWTRLIHDPELREVTGIGGLSFYDAKGMRFHLPAYMCATIIWPDTDISEDLVFTLTSIDDYNRERFGLLDAGQRQAISSFLSFLINEYSDLYAYERPKIQSAIADYWSKNPQP